MENLIAQTSQNLGNPISGIGTIGLSGTSLTPIEILALVLSSTIGLLTVIGIIYFLFVLITGAIAMINAGGDKGSLEQARKKLSTGVIGVVILIAAIFIMNLITTVLGIPQILNLQEMINRIGIQ